MLKILDKYIIKKFLGAFFFCCLIFSGIAVIVDLSDRLDRFLRADGPMSQIMFDYYINFIPWINGLLWPLFALIAVIFVSSRLARDNEFISMLNAGVNYPRMIFPFFLSALIIAGLHFVGNHFIIPMSNAKRMHVDGTYLGGNKDVGKYRDVHFFLSPDNSIYIRNYFKRDSTANNIRLEHFENNRLQSYIKAKRMRLVKKPNTWRLEHMDRRIIDEDGQEQIFDMGKATLDTVLPLFHKDFVERKYDREVLKSSQLKAHIDNVRMRGTGKSEKFEIELYRRTADAISIIILTLIGVAVASRKIRGGMGLNLAIGVALGAIFIFISKFSMTFAQSDAVPVWLGVWLPNILFGVITAFLIYKAQK